jgi:signal transduction histidine kinase
MNIRIRLVLIFLIVVIFLVGLGVYAASIYRNNLAEAETIWVHTRDELISAHRAQTAFDRQKLAWEHMVLRGHDADRYYRYLSQFYTEERETRAAIELLLSTLNRNSEPAQAASRFLNDHKLLGKRYREALKVFNAADDPAFATDRYIWDAVDNPSALLDEVIDKVVLYNGKELEQLEVRINDELSHLWIFSALVLLSLLAGLIWFIDRKIGRPLGAITRAARGIHDGDLQQRVHLKSTDEVGVLAQTINAMLDRLESVNISLADKLSELGQEFDKRKKIEASLEARTLELEEMNQELKAFNYTIAHDMRTPLRAIISFSQLLQEDLKGEIDAEKQDSLDRISSAGLRMANQIDHILQLSRISTNKIELRDVDLSQLAWEIVQELRDDDPQRDVEVDIQSGLHATGDAGLLRVVMQNLLGNAWKYTGNEDRPMVRFSSGEENGQVVYRVTDTGAGFDMAYAGKLFGVFQRLHNAEEFEGNGVGLASAQRAIRRHGGWIKGRGEAGKGAEFVFTLNQKSEQLKPVPQTAQE